MFFWNTDKLFKRLERGGHLHKGFAIVPLFQPGQHSSVLGEKTDSGIGLNKPKLILQGSLVEEPVQECSRVHRSFLEGLL